MKWIARVALTMLLTLFSLNAAFGQSLGAGRFTLPHEVHWQNAVVPAGEYRFSFESKGPAQMLVLQKLDAPRNGFMILINDATATKMEGEDRLLLVSASGQSFVSAMELPQFETTLHFSVPKQAPEKQMAEASAVGAEPVR